MKSVMTEESTTKVRAFPKLMQLYPCAQGDIIVLMYNKNEEVVMMLYDVLNAAWKQLETYH